MRLWISLSGVSKSRYRSLSVVLLCTATACSLGPGKKDLLPDAGPTTREVYEQHLSGQIADNPSHPPPSLSTQEIL